MMDQLKAIWRRVRSKSRDAEFTGAPAVRRIKAYSAPSGYVYQYYVGGAREVAGAKEYRFHVATDAKTFSEVVVRVPHEIVADWSKAGGHDLSSTEQYGVAKMLFFSHLDGASEPEVLNALVMLTPADLARIASELDL